MATMSLHQRFADRSVWRPWTIAWLGGSVLGIVNGTIRELVYKDSVGDIAAHYIATVMLILLLGLYFSLLERRWPIPTLRSALKIGFTWTVMTTSFEFGFGHFVDGKPWSELAMDYNIAAGRVWILVLAWIMVGPAVARRLHQGRLS
ncbi:MAG TPA: hypothetical protein VE174_13470 [Actinomycetota bacterium]|nr:hypothetical protein [Actinomycetota bacterium]